MVSASNIKSLSDSSLQEAAVLIRRGKLVAFPTETVYGLGADATNEKAVASIFRAKNRPQFNPLILHVQDITEAQKYGIFDVHSTRLAKRFWPGPITFVVTRQKHSCISKLASAGLDTVAIRSPAHSVAQKLIKLSGVPIAAPSANRSGHLSPTTAQHVADSLGSEISLILDSGRCKIGLESTIVDVSAQRPLLLRPGGIPIEMINSEIGPLEKPTGLVVSAPGMLTHHYAPATPLRLDAQNCDEHEALLAFGPHQIMGAKCAANLSPTGNLLEAASNLFAMLHDLDAKNCRKIAVMTIPKVGLGLAINDRLQRAAMGRN